MTSNAIRGIRRKKSSLSEVKIAVLGGPGVGKSGEYLQQGLAAALRCLALSRLTLYPTLFNTVSVQGRHLEPSSY